MRFKGVKVNHIENLTVFSFIPSVVIFWVEKVSFNRVTGLFLILLNGTRLKFF